MYIYQLLPVLSTKANLCLGNLKPLSLPDLLFWPFIQFFCFFQANGNMSYHRKLQTHNRLSQTQHIMPNQTKWVYIPTWKTIPHQSPQQKEMKRTIRHSVKCKFISETNQSPKANSGHSKSHQTEWCSSQMMQRPPFSWPKCQHQSCQHHDSKCHAASASYVPKKPLPELHTAASLKSHSALEHASRHIGTSSCPGAPHHSTCSHISTQDTSGSRQQWSTHLHIPTQTQLCKLYRSLPSEITGMDFYRWKVQCLKAWPCTRWIQEKVKG